MSRHCIGCGYEHDCKGWIHPDPDCLGCGHGAEIARLRAQLNDQRKLILLYQGEGVDHIPEESEWRRLAQKQDRTVEETARVGELARTLPDMMNVGKLRAEIITLNEQLAEAEDALQLARDGIAATERLCDTLRAQVDEAERNGHIAGWDLAHSPARCGHARGNWKDPRYGTEDYRGEEVCEVCTQLAEVEQRLITANLALGFPVLRPHIKRYEEVAADCDALRAMIRELDAACGTVQGARFEDVLDHARQLRAQMDAALAAEREIHFRFLLIAYDALGRTGWEEWKNDVEARDAIFNHLCRYDCDPNLSPLAAALRARGA